MPVLLDTSSPSSLLQQWKSIYLRGRAQGPAIATVSGLLYACTAYARSQAGEDGRLQGAAGLATVAVAPYTLVFMNRVNQTLMRAAAADPTKGAKDKEVRDLVVRWTRLNLMRGLLPLLGGALGLWSVANRS